MRIMCHAGKWPEITVGASKQRNLAERIVLNKLFTRLNVFLQDLTTKNFNLRTSNIIFTV